VLSVRQHLRRPREQRRLVDRVEQGAGPVVQHHHVAVQREDDLGVAAAGAKVFLHQA
jgi:hypothetical protein